MYPSLSLPINLSLLSISVIDKESILPNRLNDQLLGVEFGEARCQL